MIYSVRGKILNLMQNDNCFVVALETSNGVAFNLKISSFTARLCEKTDQEIRLFAHFIVRENAFELFGFSTEAEKAIFKLLISVSGVGPSFAISILNKIEHGNLVSLIASGNEEALCCCKGVGKKLASRIVLELKGKIEKFNFDELKINFENSNENGVEIFSNKNIEEAVSALIVLGYDRAKAKEAVHSQQKKGSNECSVEQLVKNALKILF